MAANPTFVTSHASRPAAPARARPGSGLGKLAAIVAGWFDNIEARYQLDDLDDHLLRDIGLDPQLVRREVLKPFWQPVVLRRGPGQ